MSTNEPLPSYPEDARNDNLGAPSTVEQPPSMRTAVLLMRVGAAVSLLSLILSIATLGTLKDDIKTQLADSNTNYSASDLDAAYGVAVAFIVILGLVGVALWLWMAWANGRGRRWARIVATVLGVLNILLTIFSISTGQTTTLPLVLSVVNLIVAIAALWYLYRPESTQFYAERSRAAY